MKIATWNVNSLKVRLAQLLTWLEQTQPDIVALQETKTLDDNFPQQAIVDAGYQVVFCGQASYNGVAILAKSDITDVVMGIPEYEDTQKRLLAATINGVRIINVYIPNGATVDSDKYLYKLKWLEKLYHFVSEQLQLYPELVILGDYNIAPKDEDVHDSIRWEGQVLVSPAERAQFFALLDLGLKDAFRLFEQPLKSYSWWDYRMLAFRRNHGLRIDHILLSDNLAKKCKQCDIYKEPRGWERPSDHAPIITVVE